MNPGLEWFINVGFVLGIGIVIGMMIKEWRND